ncbi:MBL fold metallo-hydrolase [Methanobacterium paludis]|uniref:Rhodanese-like protein n=1 Tax=Methanobacterium paludis (strain DSM 25820 / JCM 18151 / SWAN1) TaxID=868131 RepID=F6D6W5_METPW|nr:MBL fold metallo-hydrolase [Methanobacterium paludis]AEG19003.1 Rhodanese-like protein [Methanobacterium paludis]
MIFEIVKSAGIAHKSYFIGSKGAAAVIDPRRDCDIYLKLAEKNNLKIEHIFETHRNEDYTIGSLELSEIVGAEIHHSNKLNFAYGTPAKNGDKSKIGSLILEVFETPGHTDDSISIKLKDIEVSKDIYMVFTGDTLFTGEVGRCDLYGEEEIPKMAKNLYESIFQKILPLGDEVIVCPAHGSGSVCGADIREQEFTTVGYEKKTNSMLKKSRKDFVEYKINEKLYTPPYFRKMENNNVKGPKLLCKLPYLKPLSMDEVKWFLENDAQIVDVRNPTDFAGGHIPGTLNIWREGLPAFAGWFLNYEQPIIVVENKNNFMDEINRFLIRLGYDNIYGHLSGGFPVWFKGAGAVETLRTWSVHDLKKKLEEEPKDESLFLLDVRKEKDWIEGHIEGSHNVYVGLLKDHLEEVPRNKHVVVYCDAGYKASIAASLLKMNGYENATNVLGSMKAWKKAGYPVTKN